MTNQTKVANFRKVEHTHKEVNAYTNQIKFIMTSIKDEAMESNVPFISTIEISDNAIYTSPHNDHAVTTSHGVAVKYHMNSYVPFSIVSPYGETHIIYNLELKHLYNETASRGFFASISDDLGYSESPTIKGLFHITNLDIYYPILQASIKKIGTNNMDASSTEMIKQPLLETTETLNANLTNCQNELAFFKKLPFNSNPYVRISNNDETVFKQVATTYAESLFESIVHVGVKFLCFKFLYKYDINKNDNYGKVIIGLSSFAASLTKLAYYKLFKGGYDSIKTVADTAAFIVADFTGASFTPSKTAKKAPEFFHFFENGGIPLTAVITTAIELYSPSTNLDLSGKTDSTNTTDV